MTEGLSRSHTGGKRQCLLVGTDPIDYDPIDYRDMDPKASSSRDRTPVACLAVRSDDLREGVE